MKLKKIGPGTWVQYPGTGRSTYAVEWVDDAGQTVRVPQEKSEKFPLSRFRAAGKVYRRIRELAVKTDENGQWAMDKYGRQVLCLADRFPIFDSYDALHENRYYRWFFIRQGDLLTRVQFTDEQKTVHVTEDVANLECDLYDRMVALDYLK